MKLSHQILHPYICQINRTAVMPDSLLRNIFWYQDVRYEELFISGCLKIPGPLEKFRQSIGILDDMSAVKARVSLQELQPELVALRVELRQRKRSWSSCHSPTCSVFYQFLKHIF